MRLPVTWRGALAALFVCALSPQVSADEPPPLFTDAEILGKPRPYFRFESVGLSFTHFEQSGRGFSSRAGPRGGPGDQELRVEEPQMEVIAKQGDRITHRLWVPVDVVTSASADAVDVVSNASRHNEAASVDWTTTYKWSQVTNLGIRSAVHNEENWRSWNMGFSFSRSFAEDNTVLDGSVNVIADWFDHYTLEGAHDGHTARTSFNANTGVTQVLSPTTLVHLDYGITVQRGQLSNGWNIVPLTTGEVALEIMPKGRTRHALVARGAQFLPWEGALHGFYRFYADDWGIQAHTMEFELHQRLTRSIRARVNYRYHTQSAPTFFTTLTTPRFTYATADSDLAALHAQTVGLKITAEVPLRFARSLRVDVAAERYFRSNDLRVNVYSCGLGLLF
jgi:hypothetical protein